jgi:uncharacterized protein
MLRDATEADFDAVLALNHSRVQFLSPLTPARLALLHAQAAVHRVFDAGQGVEGFLIAFREGSDYDSVNYHWFNQRYAQFLYIDRIVVKPANQGTGLGRLFYEDIFSQARSANIASVTCEFDLDPPNPISESFHAKMGFTEIGRQFLPAAQKHVSMQLKVLA